MTSLFSLKREVEILHKALAVTEKKPTHDPIDLSCFTEAERQTVLNTEEIMTSHELTGSQNFDGEHFRDTIFSETEKAVIVEAGRLLIRYEKEHNPESMRMH